MKLIFLCFLGIFFALFLKCAITKSFDAALILFASVGWIINGQNVNHSIPYFIQVSSSLLMLHQMLLSHISSKSQTRGLRKSAKYFLLLTLIVIFVSLVNKVGYSGILRFALIIILIEYLATVSHGSLNNAVSYVLILQTFACLSIFGSNQPRVPIGVDSITGNETYMNLIGHPNYLAYVASINCLLFLFLFKNQNYIRTFGYLLNVSAILYSQCRSAILAVILGTAMYFVAIRGRNSPTSGNKRLRRNMLILALMLLVAFFLGNSMVQRFSEFIDTGGLTGTNSLGWRVLQWKTVLSQVHNFIWTGVGWQNSGHLLLGGLKAHNSFLQIFLELGVLGLIAYLLTFIRMLKDLASSRQGITLIPMLLISSTVDAGILYPAIAFYVLLSTRLLFKSKKSLVLEK